MSLQASPASVDSTSAPVNQDVTPLAIASSLEDETPEELLSAYAMADRMYRKLAQLFHPDKYGGDANLFDKVTKLRNEGDLIGMKIMYLSHFTPLFPTQEQMLDIAHIFRTSASQWARFIQSAGYQAYSAHMSGRLFTVDAVISDIVNKKVIRLEENIQIVIKRNIEKSRRAEAERKATEMGDVEEINFDLALLPKQE